MSRTIWKKKSLLPEVIQYDRNTCADFEKACQREWLETNGLGGFASSTICGANTRRYHGLLVASVEPMVRYLLLSKLEETIVVDGQAFELSTNVYPGAVYPNGHRWLTGFRLDPFPVFTFQAGSAIVEKRVFLVQAENTVVIEYALVEGPDCRLDIRPLIAFRGYHELTHRNEALNGTLDESERLFSIQPYGALPRLQFAHNATRVERVGEWFLNFEYPVERERGLDFHEDLYCPCVMRFDLKRDRNAVVIASTSTRTAADLGELKSAEIQRRAGFKTTIEAAANQFIATRGNTATVIAGYPWFTDWGRDTMISLPGLTLATVRFDIGREILLAYIALLNQGMLPNTQDPVSYNSVDAALWLFEAARQYVRYSGDLEFVHTKLYKALDSTIEWHVRGTRHGIGMDRDGLLCTGDDNTQLTWMDARVNGIAVTPRNGKPIEIQGLWYNALRFMQSLAREFGDAHGQVFYEGLASKAGEALKQLFWNESGGYFHDCIRPDRTCDASLRPNQLIALSLGYCAMPGDRARRALDTVERSLLTPYGLRTLAPDDRAYRGRCTGPPEIRDAAYHQGTVWPWLLGPFVAASLRFRPEAPRTMACAVD